MNWTEVDLGPVSAYAIAKKNGWTGTEAQWEALIASAPADGLKAEGYAVGKQNGTDVTEGTYYENNAKYYSQQASASATAADTAKTYAQTFAGAPRGASTAAGMTDHSLIYVYLGSEDGYTAGDWYYWDGEAWADGGVYNSTALTTDTTLTVTGAAADAKKTGDEITALKSATVSLRSGLSEGDDLNNLYKNGWYYTNNTINVLHQPTTAKGRRIIFVYGDSDPAITETLYMFYYNASTGDAAFRVHLTGDYGWQDWKLIVNPAMLNEAVSALDEKTGGDYTSYLTNGQSGYYWKTNGTKASSSAGVCTDPIFVKKGYGVKVSTGGGSSMLALTEVTSADAYVSGIFPGSCSGYVYVADHDCYISVSSLSTQLPSLTRSIIILRPEEIDNGLDYNKNTLFTGRMFRYGYYTSSGVYTGNQSLMCADFPVQAGDLITASLATRNDQYAVYIKYGDGTSEGIIGKDKDNLLTYQAIAQKNGHCYLSTYILNGSEGSYALNSVLDTALNKRVCGIFKKVVCCGDSYTAGWISQDGTGVRNNPDYNYPHYMSMLTGNRWIDCGASGTTVLDWQTNVNGYYAAKSAGKAQAYVIGLGINDRESVPIGTSADIGTNAQTYYGGMSQIVIKLATISPDAKIFINTNPNAGNLTGVDDQNEALRTLVGIMSENYNVHLLDLAKYTELYHKKTFLLDFLQGHFSAIGYEQFAEIIARVMSLYILSHVSEFQDVAFIDYDKEIAPEVLDSILAGGTELTTSASNVNVSGRYRIIGETVYFRGIVEIQQDIDSANRIFSNLPAPSDGDIVLFDKLNETAGQKALIKYGSYWRMTGTGSFKANTFALFSGSYLIGG